MREILWGFISILLIVLLGMIAILGLTAFRENLAWRKEEAKLMAFDNCLKEAHAEVLVANPLEADTATVGGGISTSADVTAKPDMSDKLFLQVYELCVEDKGYETQFQSMELN